MSTEDHHPITTQKGAATVTIFLAAMGFLTPFFQGLETALFVSAVAILVLGWLYWPEIIEILQKRGKISTLAFPSASVLIIVIISIVAILNANNQTKLPQYKGPAITLGELKVFIASLLEPKIIPDSNLGESPSDPEKDTDLVKTSPTSGSAGSSNASQLPSVEPEKPKSIPVVKPIITDPKNLRLGSKDYDSAKTYLSNNNSQDLSPENYINQMDPDTKFEVRNQYKACNENLYESCNDFAASLIKWGNKKGDARVQDVAAPFFDKACGNNVLWGCVQIGYFYEHGTPNIKVDISRAAIFYDIACTGNKDEIMPIPSACKMRDKLRIK